MVPKSIVLVILLVLFCILNLPYIPLKVMTGMDIYLNTNFNLIFLIVNVNDKNWSNCILVI